MPEREPPIGDEPRPVEKPAAPEPTQLDIENARARHAIADAQRAQFEECLAWSVQAFGDESYQPSGRHFLLDKDDEERCRRTGERPRPFATVYTVRKGDEKRHFTVTNDGQVVEHTSMEAGFGDLLLAPHPTRFFEHNGKKVAGHRFSLCWAGYDLYEPKSAEQLAEMRARREQRREEKADKEFAEGYPLFARMGLKREE
jgi:hypothetical protein